MSSLLALNYFFPFSSFLIVDFEQVNICWEIYLTFNSFNMSFNMSTKRRLELTRSNAGNSVIFLISYTESDITLANLGLLKEFIQGTLERLYKCNYQILGIQI